MFNWFTKPTDKESKTIPYIYLYRDETPLNVWEQYCKTLEISPDCNKIQIVVAGVKDFGKDDLNG